MLEHLKLIDINGRPSKGPRIESEEEDGYCSLCQSLHYYTPSLR